MNQIQQQIRRAQRRMNIQQFLDVLLWASTLTLLAAAAAVAVPKFKSLQSWFGPSAWIEWWTLLWVGGALLTGLLIAAAWAWRKRRNELAAAVEIDRRYALKDRLGSAWALPADDLATRFGQALVADAERHAQRIDVRDQFRMSPSRRAWWPLIPAAAILALCLLPNASPPEGIATTPAVHDRPEIHKTVEEIKKTLEERVHQLEEKGLTDLAAELRAMTKKLDEVEGDNERIKKESLIKLNDIRRQLEEQRKEFGDAQELKKELDRLKEAAHGPAERMGQALAENEFERAKDLALELARRLRDGELSPAEQQQLAEDMKKLAEGVRQMAQRHAEKKEQLENQLKEALRQGDLNKAERLQDQLDQARQQDEMMKKMEQMAENMERCAGQCEQGAGEGNPEGPEAPGDQGKQQAAGQALEDLAEMMEQMQADQEMMQALEDLEMDLEGCKQGLNEREGQDGNGLDGLPAGGQQWGRGLGRGSDEAPPDESEMETYKSQVSGSVQRGQTLVTGTADGENLAGQSREEAKQLMEAELSKDSDPLEEQRLPRSQRDHAKEYFDRLRKGK